MWRWLQSLPRALRQQFHGPGASAGVCVDEFSENEANLRKNKKCKEEKTGWKSHCRYSNSKDEEEKKGPHPDRPNFWNTVHGPCATFEAFGWGGALAVGIHVSHLHEKLRNPDVWRKYCVLYQAACTLPVNLLGNAGTKASINPTSTGTPQTVGQAETEETSSKTPTHATRRFYTASTGLGHSITLVSTGAREDNGKQRHADTERLQADAQQNAPNAEAETLESAFENFEEVCRKYTAVGKGIMGVQAASGGQMKSATALWKESSVLGHSKSQFNLGLCYETGQGVKKDVKKAKRYYHLAAKDDHAQAMYNLALLYLEGSDTPGRDSDTREGDISSALQLLTRAADLGLVQAQRYLGVYYLEEGGEDVHKAIQYLSQAAEHNDAECQYFLGLCYQNGYGVDQNEKLAADMYRRSAALGHTDAMYSLAEFHLQGRGGVAQNDDCARGLLKRAGEMGNKEARDLLETLKEPVVQQETTVAALSPDESQMGNISYLLKLNGFFSSPCLTDLVRQDINQTDADTDVMYDPVSPFGTLSQLYTQLFIPRGSTVAPTMTKVLDMQKARRYSRSSSVAGSDSDSGVVFKLGEDFDDIEDTADVVDVRSGDELMAVATGESDIRSRCIPRTATMPDLHMIPCV